MRTLPTIALALALSTSATLAGAQGQFYTGNRLHELAQKAQDPGLKGDLDWGVLTGYIVGVYDQSRQEGTHCKPQQVTVGQMRDVVINYLAANPAERHKDGDVLVQVALRRAWPCPKPPATPTPTPDTPGTGRQGS